MSSGTQQLPARQTALLALTLAGAAAEAVSALRAAGIRVILIKGPTIAGWLYEDPSERSYGDIDLMVSAEQFEPAEAVLARLGYQLQAAGRRPTETVWYEHCWTRTDGWPSSIDLHRTLFWDTIDPESAWSVLCEQTEVIEVCGTPVEVPGRAQRLLLLALHAAGDGVRNAKGLGDLERALVRCDEWVWRKAAQLAARLDARDQFIAGLRLTPQGAALATRLGLGAVASFEVRLRAASPPITTHGFERLQAQRSMSLRLRYLASEIFPSRAFIRDWRPLARRGQLGMLAVYLWRPLWLIAMAPRAARAWARLRRGAAL
jgi:Uncharacterised nucleotidyltransferase